MTSSSSINPTPECLGSITTDQAKDPPLCVDLDGTLIWTDSLIETCFSLVAHGLWWLLIPFWLLRGKAYLKKQAALHSPLDISTLPYNRMLVEELRRQRRAGRRIVLCTGAAVEVAEKVAEHLGVFDEIMASDGSTNLTGAAKRRALVARFGSKGFDYIGDNPADLEIWQATRKSFVVNPPVRLLYSLRRRGIRARVVFSKPRQPKLRMRLWLRALRAHQWTKNLLLFAPAALSHRLVNVEGVFAFAAFSVVASAVYILNDLLDLEADRRHSRKKDRPFASGAISLFHGLAAIPLLLTLGVAGAVMLPPLFAATLAVYFAGSMTYSLWLKRHAPVDVVMLAGLYTVRVAAGGAAFHIVISPWTLAASVFLFLSLAMVKRVSELRSISGSAAAPGRAYLRIDIEQLSSMGAAAGYLSVLVTALYLNSPDVHRLYAHPEWLWLILPVMLYWISRIWLLAARGRIHHDPVVFAIKDKTTYIVGLTGATIALLAAA